MDDRYKKRGLKFNNTFDSRALRAVHNQQRQRERRGDVVNSRRRMEDIQDSLQKNDPRKMRIDSDKQAELYQKGLERYQKLLKWKEMKKKRLEKEKRKRMPAFKTGIYHPSPPRFLVSEDQQNENGKTPHASLKKKIMTPGASLRKVPVFHLGGTPATSLLRMPQFHTGVTPSVSTKNLAPAVKHKEQENLGPSHRTRGDLKKGRRAGGKGGAARDCTTLPGKFDDQEDLGIKPLPLTPAATLPQRKVEKPMLPSQALPSFAPADFTFNFEAPQTSETKRTEHHPTGCTDDLFSSQVLEVSLDYCHAKKDDKVISKEDPPMEQKHSFLQKNGDQDISETGDSEMQSVHEKNLLSQGNSAGCTPVTAKSEKSPHKEAFGSDIPEAGNSEMETDSTTLSDELPGDATHYKNSGAEAHLELLNNEEICGDPVTSEQISRCDEVKPEGKRSNLSDMSALTLEVEGKDDSRPKKNKTTTPAKRLTRRSVSCCFDGTVTPVLSRLRPRTPCSRSTRRSLSAHCDMPHELYTPGRRSVRKTPRRSINKAAKCQDPHEAHMVSPVLMSLDGGIIGAGTLVCDTKDRMVDAANKSQSQLHLQNTPLEDPSQEESCSPLMTPENVLRKEQGMWTVETSPWISSQRSKKKKHTASGLQGIFDDIPIDDSPVPHPVIPSVSVSPGTGTSLSSDTICTNLLSLLQPSSSQNAESPEVDVWDEVSPAISALGSSKTSRRRQSGEKKTPPKKIYQVPIEMHRDYAKVSVSSSANNPVASEPPSISADILPLHRNGENKEDRSEKRKSRKSVMFVISEQESLKADTHKLPGTPVRTSSRVSMGLLAKADPSVSELVIPEEDLIAFDSPMSEKKISCTSRRKSCRVSLLPGMTLSPPKEEAAPIPTDLITWDSPAQTKRASGHVAPSLVTPVRRSRRLSKIL